MECPDCDGPLIAKKGRNDVTIRALRTARPNDRIKAVDTLGKYGPGLKVETEMTVVHPDVVDRLSRTASLIASRQSWTSDELLTALERVWV